MPVNKDANKIKAVGKNYTDFADVAFKTAFSITGQRENAEDIAQVVTMRFLLNENKINPDSAQNWIIKTSKNESYLVLGKNNKEIFKASESFEDYEQEITDSILENSLKQTEIVKLFNKMKHNLSAAEQDILHQYFTEGKKLSQVYSQDTSKIKKVTLYQKIYRLRTDAKAAYYLNRGMIASKQIVTFNLNQSIIRFIKKYRECVEAKSFSSMTRYFSEIGIPELVPKFCVTETIDYDIVLLGKSKYKIYTHFVNKRGYLEYFSFIFSFDERKYLILLEVPNNEEMDICCVLNKDRLPVDFFEKISETDSRGLNPVCHDDLIEVMESLEESDIKITEIKAKKKIRVDRD